MITVHERCYWAILDYLTSKGQLSLELATVRAIKQPQDQILNDCAALGLWPERASYEDMVGALKDVRERLKLRCPKAVLACS
jgi:hypothetical protein